MRDDIENALEQLDVLTQCVRRLKAPVSTGDLITVRDIDRALFKARRYLEDALPYDPVRPSSECTGICASWCPIHGTCTCPTDEEGERLFKEGGNEVVEDENCPLHARSSGHAEVHRP